MPRLRKKTKADRKRHHARIEDNPQELHKQSTGLSTGLPTDAATIGGIRRRDKAGKIVSRASRIRAERCPAPDLKHRKRLFADGQRGLAWRAEAAYPLGVYLLRAEITQEQFDSGRAYALAHSQAAHVLGVPRRTPRSVVLDPSQRGRLRDDRDPTPAERQRAATFLHADAALRAQAPKPWHALQLCLISEVMGKIEERLATSTVDQALPSYAVADLQVGLEAVREGGKETHRPPLDLCQSTVLENAV